jgi:SAM-dependent methyltransferase
MDDRFLELLACPACGSDLLDDWSCTRCAAAYGAPDGVPALRLPAGEPTERVRDFYSVAPFPGYPPRDSLGWLRARAERSRFTRMLDEAIPGDARIVEVGCGTGQMSLYLARADRIVVGADLTRASLLLGADAARRFQLDKVMFVECDLAVPALREARFDIVYCSGVLHHTPDPRRSFAHVAKLARPGGVIILGLYNHIARLPLRMRRGVMRMTGGRWIPSDPVLRDRAAEPARRDAWLRDQYRHPEEHSHSLGEVRCWFAENDVDYLRAFPSAQFGDDEDDLFASQSDGWWLEDLLAQLGWMRSLGAEGGLFITVGRRR